MQVNIRSKTNVIIQKLSINKLNELSTLFKGFKRRLQLINNGILSSGKNYPLDYITVYPPLMIDRNKPNFIGELRRKNILKNVVF